MAGFSLAGISYPSGYRYSGVSLFTPWSIAYLLKYGSSCHFNVLPAYLSDVIQDVTVWHMSINSFALPN